MSSLFSIYFPIAEVQLNAFYVIGIGFITGIISGLLGIGGGFISTPLLTIVGVVPSVAVAASAHQIVGASFSSILARIGKKRIDHKLGLTLTFAGIFGSLIGLSLFQKFRELGNIDLIITCFYVVLMTLISTTSILAYFRPKKPVSKSKTPRFQFLLVRYRVAGVECSVLLPILLGLLTGILVVIMGVGGGFILVPAMTYLMKIENDVAVGTSLLQIFLITILVIIFHIFFTGMLDIMLGTLLLIGAGTGAQISSIISLKIGKKRIINLLLGLLTLIIAVKFTCDLFFSSKDKKILIEEFHEQQSNSL